MEQYSGRYTVLRLAILLCGVCPHTAQNDEFSRKVKQAVYDSYDNSKTLEQNYLTLLTLFCPRSVYCSESDANASIYKEVEEFWDDENGTEISKNIRKARQFLLEIRDQLQGCCEPCSCEKVCIERQNCCPEYQVEMANANSTSAYLQECVYASVKAYTPNSIVKPDTWGVSYFMVTRCSANASARQQFKCQNPDKYSIEDIRPFYSIVSKRIYKNKQCAECNNDPNVVPWNVEVTMNERFTLTEKVQIPQTPEDFYRVIVNTRYFKFFTTYFNPPEEVDYKAYSCFYKDQKVEESCARTDSTEIDDTVSLIYRLCTVDTTLYHTVGSLFNNIFCHLCNSTSSSSLPCESTTRTATSSFVAILVPLSNIQEVQTTPTQAPCNCHEYYNRKVGECRDIRCPPGTYFALCQCVEFMKLSRLMIRVYMETTPRGPIGALLQPVISKTWVNSFLKSVKQLLMDSWEPVSIQTTFMFRELSKTDNNYVKLYTAFLVQFTDTYADRDNFKHMFDSLLKGVWIQVGKDYLKVQLGLVYEVDRYDNDTALFPTHDRFKDDGRQLEYIFNISDLLKPTELVIYSQIQPFNKLIYCRRIAMSNYEVDILKNDTKLKQIYPSLSYVFREEDSTLCLEDYIYMMVESHSSPMFYGRSAVVLLLCQVFWVILSI